MKKINIKRKMNNFKNLVIKKAKAFKKNPKKEMILLLNRINETIKSDVTFSIFVIGTLINTILLRFFTINTIENLFYFKPLFSDLTIILLLGSISYLLKEKNRFRYLFITNIVLTLICIINSCYYTFYTSFSSISLLTTSKYVVAVGDAVVENVLRVQDLVYIWVPIVMLVVHIRLRLKKQIDYNEGAVKSKSKHVLYGALLSMFIVVITLTPVEISRLAKQWNREYIVMRFGIYVYHVNDLIKTLEPEITSLFGYDEAYKTFKEYYEDTSDTQDWINEYTGIFNGKNIISIHLESMQSFLIGLEFNGEEVTPNLNKIVENSIYFDNFYSQVSVGTSSDSEFTLNTSLMPTNIGTAFVNYYDRSYVSIPSLLKEKGYYTFSMHGNNASFWNRNVMHKTLGYDRFYSKSDYNIDEVIGLGLSDKSFFKQSTEYIKELNLNNQPYYGTIIMMSNHTPFSETDKYGEFDVDLKTEVTNADGTITEVSYPYMEGTKLGNYFKSVHYADSALGEFIDELTEAGIMDNTVIVMYGDHDARLPIEDYIRLYNYDYKTDSVLDSNSLDYVEVDDYQYDILRRTPFLIYSNETIESLHTTVDNVMGMYDVMPTLGNMFGFYNKYALGNDIFNIGDDNIVVFPNGNWVTNKVYYNAQKSAYLTLKGSTEISQKYIDGCNKYANNLLSASNSLIVYDLINKENELKKADTDYIDERISK